MMRLRSLPSKLVPRVLTICLALALAMLWRDGGTLEDAWSLTITTLPLEPGGASMLRLLLERAIASFFLISFALVFGQRFALALTIVVSRPGGRASRFMGWVGLLVGGVPPMGWALGALVWLVQVQGLPVETLFPHQPSPESDSLVLALGRMVWSWMVPVSVLAMPVFGVTLFSLSQKLAALLREPSVVHLEARGLRRAQILHRHLAPLLRVHQVRLAMPIAALLLAFDIPVEELLGFEGWGSFAADQLTASTTSGRALAAVFWMGGLILAGILAWLSLADRQNLPHEEEAATTSLLQPRSAFRAAGAILLMLALMLPLRWTLPEAIRAGFEDAHLAWTQEIRRALLVGLAAMTVVGVSGFLMSLSRFRLLGRGWAEALALSPLLAALMFWERDFGIQGWPVALVAAIPGIAAFREMYRDADDSDFVEASRALGQSQMGVWRHHLLPRALPFLPGLALRSLSTIMMMFCMLDFYSASAATSWGGQMRQHAQRVLDAPLPALAPVVLLALWSLSFLLLGRAFGNQQPPPRFTPFDR